MESTPTDSAKTNGTREKLVGEMQAVIDEAENWLRSSSNATGEELRAAKAKFAAAVAAARHDLVELEQRVVEKTKHAAKATDEYVKENPWKAVGLGAAIGMICGLLIARK